MKNSTRFLLFLAMVAGIVIGFVIAARVDMLPQFRASEKQPQKGVFTPVTGAVETRSTAGPSSNAFIDVVEAAKPAVVNLQITAVFKHPDLDGDLDGMRKFFEGSPFGDGEQQESTSLGSGVVIDPKGYIITNGHVVEAVERNGGEIKVMFADDTKAEGEIVGVDESTDLAVLKIKKEGTYPAMPFGDSNKLQVGEWALALGNPFGLGSTVTAGVVSAVQRKFEGQEAISDYIQTDAAINRGNSGGALVNMKGQLVGINTFIFSQTGGSMGIGFAIPSNLVKDVARQLIEKGAVERGWLGIQIQNMDDKLAKKFKVEDGKGVVVTDLSRDGGGSSPAGDAGIKPEDVIVEFNGQKVSSSKELQILTAQSSVGSTAKLGILRDGKRMEIKVTLGKRPKLDQARGETPGINRKEPEAANVAKLGLTLQDMTQDQIEEFGEGVMVKSVERGSPAAKAGIQPNDVIMEVEKQPVRSVGEFKNAVKDFKAGDGILLHIRGTGFVVLELGEG